ncbi:hypothetical protein JHD48_10565, partial [Sulfurimonas sp. SAG-AH-194-I05]
MFNLGSLRTIKEDSKAAELMIEFRGLSGEELLKKAVGQKLLIDDYEMYLKNYILDLAQAKDDIGKLEELKERLELS